MRTKIFSKSYLKLFKPHWRDFIFCHYSLIIKTINNYNKTVYSVVPDLFIRRGKF